MPLSDEDEETYRELQAMRRSERSEEEQREYMRLVNLQLDESRKRRREELELPESETVEFVEGFPEERVPRILRRAGVYEPAADELLAHPGLWAIVVTGLSRNGATRLASKFRNGAVSGFKMLRARGAIESRIAYGRHEDMDSPDALFDVYARFEAES